MTIPAVHSNPASGNPLFPAAPKADSAATMYSVVAQSIHEIRDLENAPAVSMLPYLLKTEQMRLLTIISIYSMPGSTVEQARLLYMNPVAFRIWEEMGRTPNVIGSQHRPEHAALLTFGVPFSD